jgi:type IV secretion system protein VirD4
MTAPEPFYRYFLGDMENGQPYRYGGDGSLLTIGRPGSGKSQCHAMTNLLSWPGSALVLDVKDELFETTSLARSKIGRVLRFAPFEKVTARYNPLAPLSVDIAQCWTDAQLLADMLHPGGAAGNANEYFDTAAREIITAAIFVAAADVAPEHRMVGNVLDTVSGLNWDGFIKALEAFGTKLPQAKRTANNLTALGKAERTLESVRSTAYFAMNAWSSPAVERATSGIGWLPADLHGSTPLTVYVTASAQQLAAQSRFFRAVIGQHVEQLMRPHYLNAARPILFMLDEFPALGNMLPIRDALAVGRGYGLRLWLLAQFTQQITAAYPDETPMRAVAVRSFMNPDHDTAKRLSDELGDRAGALDAGRVPVASPQDLTGKDFAERILTFVSGFPPARLKKVYAYNDSRFIDALGAIPKDQAVSV